MIAAAAIDITTTTCPTALGQPEKDDSMCVIVVTTALREARPARKAGHTNDKGENKEEHKKRNKLSYTHTHTEERC